MKKYIVISNIFALCLAMSCTDGFDESYFEKNSVIPNGNKIIGTERVYGDKGGIKMFHSAFLSNEKSIYYYGKSGTSSDKNLGEKSKEYTFNGNYIIGKINELGDVVWEKAFNDCNWVGGIVQNSRNDLYVYGQNNKYQKYITNISKDGIIKELNLENLPNVYSIDRMKHINDDLFIAIGPDDDENDNIIILKLSAMKVEVVQSVVCSVNEDWNICYAEQSNTENYDMVLTCENEKSQLITRKIRITNAGIVTLWEKTITSDMEQNPLSTLTSGHNYPYHQAVKIDNEICIIGYGENNMEHRTGDDYRWNRGLVANLNYDTGELNWLRTIPYGNTTVYDVFANAIFYTENNFYVIGQYNSALWQNDQYLSYGFVQKISREGVLSNVYIFGDEKENALFYDGIILNRKLFLFGYKGREFDLKFPYQNLTVNSQAYQAWFVSCNINDF